MRAFIVGNGPSLRQTNLDRLIGEDSFACNNIHLIYPFTFWRPTHYVRAEENATLDPSTWMESMVLQMSSDAEIWCNPWYIKWMDRYGYKTRKSNVITTCAHRLVNFDSEYCPHTWHLPRLCTFGSSVNIAIQIAVMSGKYNALYLVGCDLGYKDSAPSHFDASYEQGGEQPARLANMNTLVAHIIGKRSSPIPIYNATLGGDLEVYERVNYESLFA